MANDSIHVGDIGTTFTVTLLEDSTAIDVSAATKLQIIFRKPDGDLLTVTAALATDGKDGKIKYVTKSGDLDQAEYWSIQAYIEIGTAKWHSDVDEFRVNANLS